MGQEKKETFTEFGSLFKFVDDISDEATLPTEMTGFILFLCMTNCDLSAQWKGLCKGGAAKYIHSLALDAPPSLIIWPLQIQDLVLDGAWIIQQIPIGCAFTSKWQLRRD